MPHKDKEKKKQYMSEYYQTYKITHKEEIKRKRRLAYLKNKEKVKEQSDRYYREHREEKLRYDQKRHKNNRQHFNEYIRTRRHEELNIRLMSNIQRRIISSLRAIGGIRKAAHTKELVGCSTEFLKQYLQQTAIRNGYFDFDIEQYNGKRFHVDHVVPCAAFNLKCKYHQRLCFHWSNLQILEARENIRKSDRIAA